MAEPALRLEDLRKSYGDTVALGGASFAVAEGQMFGFVGPNGAGKTTLMRIVLGVLEADSGAVLWRGAPIDVEARRRIGYMPEERGLYPKMRVRDQLVYMARLHGADEAAAGAAADRWLGRLGIEDRGADAVEALSLGNQQRVQLGVALVHEPDLLVLDEPFSGLDPDGVDALSGALTEEIERRRVPVIFSSHQLELVERLCDSLAIIAAGRIVASGPLSEVGGGRPLAEVFREATRREAES
jgi:ABC-2 type transport system ATP-binding protein